MNQIIASANVAIELGSGFFTINWPQAEISLGPVVAAAVVNGHEVSLTDTPGKWSIDSFENGDQIASWQVADSGVQVKIKIRHGESAVEITTSYRRANNASSTKSRLEAICVLRANTELRVARRLVEGYDSWAYAGVRTHAAGDSCWNSALVAEDGRTLAFQALSAQRFCTRIAWAPQNEGGEDSSGQVFITAGSTPRLIAVDGTWGYRVGESGPLNLQLGDNETVFAETLAIDAGLDAVALVETLAAKAGKDRSARLWTGRPIQGWESWYHYGFTVTATDVVDNSAELLARYRKRKDIDVVQIDDGWQSAYGAWWPNEKFPTDLGELTQAIKTQGGRPGIWIAPFRVEPNSLGVATDNPDWCLQTNEGVPWREERHQTWCLDATHPSALRWLYDLGEKIKTWGFVMAKIDFTYLAALDNSYPEPIVRYEPHATGLEAFRLGWQALVAGLGDDVYTLACGTPTLPVVGLAHANRVGHDLAMPRVFQKIGHPVDQGWTGAVGVRAQARNAAARWAQHSRWYEADPEVVMTWSDPTNLAAYDTETARIMATMAALVGGPFLLADDLCALTQTERAVIENDRFLDLLVRSSPSEMKTGAPYRPIDIFARADKPEVSEHVYSQGDGLAETWTTTRDNRLVVAWFNWGDSLRLVKPAPDFVGAQEVWTGEEIGADLSVPPGAVRIAQSASNRS